MINRKQKFSAPYETLSDLAIGSLGIFIILVIFLVVISSFSNGEDNSRVEEIAEKNRKLAADLITIEDEYKEQKKSNNADKRIKEMQDQHDQNKRTLHNKRIALDKKLKELKQKEGKIEELNSAVNVLDQQREKHADYLVEMDKMEIQLKSFVEHNTGNGVDKTGRPYLYYGTYTPTYYSSTNDTLFLIGWDGTYTKEQFLAFLNSVRHGGDIGFFILFSSSNSKYKQDAYKPKWSEDIVYNKAGWVDINIEKKEGY